VEVLVDADHDHRTALSFTVTAGGVLQDALYYDDDRQSTEWDAVWEGAAAVDEGGWSAELAVPLSLFRIRAGEVQTWAFAVRRAVPRASATEVDWSFARPRSGRGLVSRLGHLTGLEGLEARRDLELAPYVAARTSLRPQFSYDLRPRPRLAQPSADVGLDQRARLASTLTLNAAVNPDFGQVEADQLILNLSTFEVFRPEKRPFFTHGLDLFQPVGTGENVPVPQQLFYSRRIGLDTPILAAAKVTGRASDTVQVGLLDAVTAGVALPAGYSEARPDRDLGVRWPQPFRLAPGGAAAFADPLTQNFFAGVARWTPAPGVTLGATGASALPFGPACTEAEDALDEEPSADRPDGPFRPRRCSARSGHAAALDWNLRSRDAAWGAFGQVAGSLTAGGPPSRTLADGTVLRRGDAGAGVYATAGKVGGEPLRLTLHYEYETPRLDLNATGFQRTQNEQYLRGELRFVRPGGGGPFLSWEAYLAAAARRTTDGRGLDRGDAAAAGATGKLRGPQLVVGCETGYSDPRHDVRELGTGVPLLRAPWLAVACWSDTDPARAISANLFVNVGRNFEWGPYAPVWFGAAEAFLTVRPHPRVETRLGVTREENVFAVKYVDDDGAGRYLLGALHGPTLSFTLRQTVVLTPRLTFQVYGQLFSAYEAYGPFWTATSQGATIGPRSLVPVASPAAAGFAAGYDSHTTALNLNAVLRWEYRLGSFLYVVGSRAQREAQPDLYDGPRAVGPRALGPGPATDTILVKWSYWWSV
jgi:hypothetical protein